MKKILILLSLIAFSGTIPTIQAAKEKTPYTVGNLLRDALLITGGSGLMCLSAYGAYHAYCNGHDIPLIAGRTNPIQFRQLTDKQMLNSPFGKASTSFMKYSAMTLITGAIGFSMIHRGVSNMNKN